MCPAKAGFIYQSYDGINWTVATSSSIYNFTTALNTVCAIGGTVTFVSDRSLTYSTTSSCGWTQPQSQPVVRAGLAPSNISTDKTTQPGLSLITTKSGTAGWGAVSQVKKYPIVLDFGTTPVTTKSFYIDVRPISHLLTQFPIVSALGYSDTIANIHDELEMDSFTCAAEFNSTTNILSIS